jgi:TRAP-type C4-dicarboxylate transport system permease large subunit
VRADIEDSDGHLTRLAKRLIYGMLLSVGLIATAVLYAFSTPESSAVAGVFSLAIAGLLYLSFRKRRGIRATPQFTRQNLRQRQGK